MLILTQIAKKHSCNVTADHFAHFLSMLVVILLRRGKVKVVKDFMSSSKSTKRDRILMQRSAKCVLYASENQ